jgi:hypothetical protein
MLKQLWNDDGGYIVTTEMLLIFVILVLGLIAGLANLRTAIVNELTESGLAILNLNQSFTIAGITSCTGSTGASNATDTPGSASLTFSNAAATSINFSLCP